MLRGMGVTAAWNTLLVLVDALGFVLVDALDFVLVDALSFVLVEILFGLVVSLSTETRNILACKPT